MANAYYIFLHQFGPYSPHGTVALHARLDATGALPAEVGLYHARDFNLMMSARTMAASCLYSINEIL